MSPLRCEELVDKLDFKHPNTDEEGVPQKTFRGDEVGELVVFDIFKSRIPEIERYYQMEYRGTEPMSFEWYPPYCLGEKPHCENSVYGTTKKWVRQKDRDFTCILFLSDFQETIPFDSDFEVFGGKLEFPQHGFGFNPERGTLLIFPSGPNFLNNTTPIAAGELFQVRFHIAAQTPYQYNPNRFPGNYLTWFQDMG